MKKDLIITLVATIAAAAASAAPAMAQTAAAGAPPSPTAAAMLTTLQKVCLPVLSGGDLKTSAGAAGFKLKDGIWVLSVGGERRIELQPPDTANPHICGASVYARPGSAGALRQALGAWAGAQTPPLAPATSDAQAPPSASPWSASSWSGRTPAGTLGVALGQEQPAQGQTTPDVAESDLLVSLTPA